MAAETAYIADYLEEHKDEILDRWRRAAEAEPPQGARLAKMDDAELLDHLPALTEALIGVLRSIFPVAVAKSESTLKVVFDRSVSQVIPQSSRFGGRHLHARAKRGRRVVGR